MQTILITGGAGFLGSHLCDRLLADGHAVICMDNFYTGRRQNIQHLLAHPRFEVLRHDIIEKISLEVDAIYNLACPASPIHYQRHPIQTTRASVEGTINMLELARRLSIPLFHASTSEVYGDPKVHPQPENYWGNVNPIGPRACYDEGKRCAETLCFDYHRQAGVSIKVARLFNTYGPRMAPDDGRVVSNFVLQALRGEDITIYGDGTQTRSFCFYSDMIEAFVRLMNTPADVTGPMNLGNPGEFTMLELAEMVIRLTGSSSRITHKPLPADDPVQRKPDIAYATSLLKWEPHVPLEEGIKEVISYFRAYLEQSH